MNVNITSAANNNMIKQQLRTDNVLDIKILDLFDTIPRHLFVPDTYTDFAYSDFRIPLGHNQQMLTPSEEGLILQSLQLQGHETVLEIGTGSGFFTAMLSRLCQQVISIEYFSDFTKKAAKKLKAQNIENATLITGDGCRGWLDNAPYDIIIFTGAINSITETHRLQVNLNGKLFAILGKPPIMQGQLWKLSKDKNWDSQILFGTSTPLLIDKFHHKKFNF